MHVSDDGTIYIFDENKIKVYDSSGKPLKILGGKGQGPGEFEQASGFVVSNSGFMSAINNFGTSLTVYKGEEPLDNYNITQWEIFDEFMKKIDDPFKQIMAISILNENKTIIHAISGTQYKSGSLTYHTLLLQEGDSARELMYEGTQSYYAEEGKGLAGIPEQGWFYWNEIPGNNIVYGHPKIHKDEVAGTFNYWVNVLSLDSYETKQIRKEYILVSLHDSLIAKYENDARSEFTAYMYPTIADYLKSNPYYQPYISFLSDENYIFVFTNSKNESGEYLTDVFDAKELKYVRSAHFPEIPKTIKNGFAYSVEMGDDGLPRLYKYKIEPLVYVNY